VTHFPRINLRGAKLINPPPVLKQEFQLPFPKGELAILDNLPFVVQDVHGDRLILRFKHPMRLILKPGPPSHERGQPTQSDLDKFTERVKKYAQEEVDAIQKAEPSAPEDVTDG
jgi:hypothetical protein